MTRMLRWPLVGLFSLGAFVLPSGHGQGPSKVVPRLEPVAETRLLMEGLAHPNFRGIERKLATRPEDTQAWTFARGQALLIAETANLLMLRPPKNKGEAIWFDRAMDLRLQATQLAQHLGKKDYERSRSSLQQVAGSCNRCHQSFRINVDIAPFQQQPDAPPLRKVDLR